MNHKHTYINRTPIILASSSERRQALLRACQIQYHIVVPDIVEVPKAYETPQEYCARNAREKAAAAAQKIAAGSTIDTKGSQNSPLILSADTIVFLNNKILEKPQSYDEAFQMLSELSGSTHFAYTGYSFFRGLEELLTRVIESKVTFRELSDSEIHSYIETKEPYDKAGGYGISGAACGFLECVDGSYTNVMGLPLSHVIQDLKNFDRGI